MPYESKPREDEIENLVDQLDVDPELAEEAVRGAVEIVEMESAVDGGEE